MKRFVSFVIFLGFVLITLGPHTAQAVPEVVFKEETQITHGPLTLSDIVEGDLSETSYSLNLGSLPNPGEVKIISQAYVQMTARRKNMEPPQFSGGPVRVQVKRLNRILSDSELVNPVKETIRQEYSLPEETDVKIVDLPEEVTVLPGPFGLSVRSGNSSYGSRRGELRYRFDVIQQEKQINSFRAQVEISQSDQVAFAKRPLSRGVIVQPEMVNWKDKDIGTSRGGLLRDAENLIGKKLTRSIRAGKSFNEKYLEAPTVIERRDQVTIRYQVGNMRITTRGEAQEDGSIGDQIKVENLSTEKTITAQIINENIVETSRN